MRLGLSVDRLCSADRRGSGFHGPGGRFDRQQFEFVLRQGRHAVAGAIWKNRERVAKRQQDRPRPSTTG